MSNQLVCGDILQFQEELKRLRNIDDKIIYTLNVSLPTESIKARTSSNPENNCKTLYEQLKMNYGYRESLIENCIQQTADVVKDLRQKREKNSDDITVEKKFKSEQRKLRVLKQEQGVEDIVKDRTLKAFNERCRQYFRGDSF